MGPRGRFARGVLERSKTRLWLRGSRVLADDAAKDLSASYPHHLQIGDRRREHLLPGARCPRPWCARCSLYRPGTRSQRPPGAACSPSAPAVASATPSCPRRGIPRRTLGCIWRRDPGSGTGTARLAPQKVHPPGRNLHHEQDIDTSQTDRVHVQKSQARMPLACAVRNWAYVGPARLGAGPVPALARIAPSRTSHRSWSPHRSAGRQQRSCRTPQDKSGHFGSAASGLTLRVTGQRLDHPQPSGRHDDRSGR
jgi:hypothetical protein